MKSFYFPYNTPSLNQYLGPKGHWVKDAERKKADKYIDMNPYLATEDKQWVQVTRFYSGNQKEMDGDNIIGGVKPILDGLKQWRWIRNDTPRYVERLEPVQVRGREEIPDGFFIILYKESDLKHVPKYEDDWVDLCTHLLPQWTRSINPRKGTREGPGEVTRGKKTRRGGTPH